MARSPLKPERIRADQAAAILGLNKRTVQAMALRGELPNAAKIGGVWTFDEVALRNFITERVQKPKIRQPLNAPARAGRVRGPLADVNIERACEEASLRIRERARRERLASTR